MVKDIIVSLFFFFVGLLFLCFPLEFVRASDEIYSELHFKNTVMSTAIKDTPNEKRSILEQGDRSDLCKEKSLGSTWQNMSKQGKSPCPILENNEGKVVAGEGIIWANRPQYFDFTIPFRTSEVDHILVHVGAYPNKTIWIFLRPFTLRLWIAIVVTFIYTGVLIAILEYRVGNPNFGNSSYQKQRQNKGPKRKNGLKQRRLKEINSKTCESVAGDVTIRANRAQFIDFTLPYLSSEVFMLVHGTHEWNQTLWTFLKPFSRRLWITLVGLCIYIGVAVAILEYRVGNPKFRASFFQKAIMVIWFPISTFFFNEGKILNRNSKVVLVMWLSMIFIVVQIFTATLSSWLTLDQLRPRLPSSYENVGYQDGSFLRDYIIKKYNCSGTNLRPLKSVEEYKDALSNGSVTAVIDELPYVELFLAKYGSDYMKFGPINQESGIAFAFPRGFPLLSIFSRAVINITESDTMIKMKRQYLGFRTPDVSQPNQPVPQNLDIQSFIGLFIFMGIVTISAIISSEISLRRENKKIIPISTDE